MIFFFLDVNYFLIINPIIEFVADRESKKMKEKKETYKGVWILQANCSLLNFTNYFVSFVSGTFQRNKTEGIFLLDLDFYIGRK